MTTSGRASIAWQLLLRSGCSAARNLLGGIELIAQHHRAIENQPDNVFIANERR